MGEFLRRESASEELALHRSHRAAPLTRHERCTDEGRDDHDEERRPDPDSIAGNNEERDLDEWDHDECGKERGEDAHRPQDTGAWDERLRRRLGSLPAWIFATFPRSTASHQP